METKDLRLIPTFKQEVGKLDEEIRKVIKNGFYGVSTYVDTNSISVWIDDTLTKEDIQTIKTIVATFDPSTLPVEPPVIEPEDFVFKGDLKDALAKLGEVSLKTEEEIKEIIKQILVLIYNKG